MPDFPFVCLLALVNSVLFAVSPLADCRLLVKNKDGQVEMSEMTEEGGQKDEEGGQKDRHWTDESG